MNSSKDHQTKKKQERKNSPKNNITTNNPQEISEQTENNEEQNQNEDSNEDQNRNEDILTPNEKKMITQRLTALLNQIYQMGERLNNIEQIIERTEGRVHHISSHLEASSLGSQNAKSKKIVSK